MPHCMTFYRRVLCVCHVCLHCCACTELYMYVPVQVCVCRHTRSGQRSTPCFHPQSPATLIFETLMIPWDPPFSASLLLGLQAHSTTSCFCFCFFTWELGIKLKYLRLCGKDLRDRTLSPALHAALFGIYPGLLMSKFTHLNYCMLINCVDCPHLTILLSPFFPD